MSTQIQISPASGITVGTTAVTSGTVGRVFFQGTGDVVQQSSSLFWDNTNSRLGVGATPATTVRLDVRAQGALSTDIALRVRNSANSGNFLEINGNGTFILGEASLTRAFQYISDGRLFMAETSGNFIELNPSTTNNRLFGGNHGWEISTSSVTKVIESRTPSTALMLYGGTLQLATGLNASDGTNVMSITNGTAPTANYGDSFRFYSKDIVAGNAAPHFRTENGSIVKLYQNVAVTTPQGLADALTNLGLLAASTISTDPAGWTTIVKSANQDVTNSATLEDDTDLQFSVVAGGYYMVEMDLIISSNNITGDYQNRFAVSSGYMKGKGFMIGPTATGAAQVNEYAALSATTTTPLSLGSPSTDIDYLVSVKIIYSFNASANATFSYQFANVAAGAGRISRTWKGSILKYKRLD